MNRRQISLILAANLLAWSSGLLLSLHTLQAGEDHDSHHCQQCLLLHAGCPATVDVSATIASGVLVDRSAPPVPAAVHVCRTAHPAFGSRDPPAGC